MTDLLRTVGILPKLPDPSLYEAQKKVADQKVEVMDNLSKTIKQVEDSSLYFTEKSDLPGTLLQRYKTLESKTATLKKSSVKMNPDKIESERQIIENELNIILSHYKKIFYEKEIKTAKEIYDKANVHISNNSRSPEEKKQYENLAEKAKALMDQVNKKINLETVSEGFQDISGGVQEEVQEEIPGFSKASRKIFGYDPLETNTGALAIELKNLENINNMAKKESTLSNIFRIIVVCFTIISLLLGAIVSTNTHIRYDYFPIRLFYFIYGAVFFPIVVLYGAIFPPEWICTFVPLINYKEDAYGEGNIFTKMFKNIIGYRLATPAEERTTDEQNEINLWKMILRVLCALSSGVFLYGAYYMKRNVIDKK
jgi:hypothetical protein